MQGTVASRMTSQAPSRGHQTSGRVKPVGSLQAQKTSSRSTAMQSTIAPGVSSNHSEGRPHPLSSELPRVIPATRPIAASNPVTSARQGALRPPSETGPSTMQNTTQRKGVARPFAPTTQGPQRVGNMLMKPQDEKPRVGGARRVLIPTATLPETDETEIALMSRKTASLPSVKLSSVGSLAKPLVTKRSPENNLATTKAHSVTSASAATVRPSFQKEPRPTAKAEHPMTRGASSRIGQPQPNAPPTTGAEPQSTSRKKVVASSQSSQQVVGQSKPVWGGRPMPKGPKPVAKALAIRSKPGVMKNPDPSKPAPKDVPLPPSPTVCPTAVPLPPSPVYSPRHSPQFEPTVSEELPIQTQTYDTHVARDANRPSIDSTPSRRDVNIQESPSKTPITALLSSIQHGFLLTPSSPLSPPQTYVTGVIARAYPPDSPTARKDIACVSFVPDCAARQVLEMMGVN